MIKKLDRYLLTYFFTSFVAVTLSIGLTIIVINMVEELRDFIDHDVSMMQILEYYFYFGGWVLRSFVPMFVLLASLFSISMLARRHEILAMKACGLSLYRITLPLLIVTLIIALGHFYYNEYIFPDMNKNRLEIKKFTIEKRSRASHTNVRNIYRQISPGSFYTMARFDVDRQTGESFKMYRSSDNKATEIITASAIVYRDFLWQAVAGNRRIFSDSAGAVFTKFDTLLIPDIDDKPDDLARRLGKPEDMGLEELERYIDLMHRTGGPYKRESVDLKTKYSFPLSSFIVVLICVPFASNPRRAGIAVSIAVGAGIALAYFVLFRMLQSAGWNDKIPEDVAAWGVNGLFLVIGLILMWRAPK
ncbi:MAG: LptF/LptG family permease [candidate division Zixibacteria bacterium]|nr:LptF/LptG family permease [candidate division Zixibacteria bacterium]